MVVHLDGAGGQRASQPLQISELEGQQHEADARRHVHCAFRVQEVMRRPVAHVFFKAFGDGLVHPARGGRGGGRGGEGGG